MPLHELSHKSHEPALYRLQNDRLSLTFLPAVGGRLISLQAEGREWLWHDLDRLAAEHPAARNLPLEPEGIGGLGSWANVGGSKTWPAPQGWDGDGQWSGPPDPVLDGGEYRLEFTESTDAASVQLTSGPDDRSGLQVERRFVVPTRGSTFQQTNTFTNISDRTVRWSIWEVAQVDCGLGVGADRGAVEVTGGSSGVVDLGTHRGQLEVQQSGEDAVIQIQNVVAKRGFTDAAGRIRYRDPVGRTLELASIVDPAATYPDAGSRVELWMQAPQPGPMEDLQRLHPTAWLVELEVLSPLITLEPGTSTSLTIEWLITG